YTLTLADQRHVVSEISNGVNPTQAYSAVYQARRIRLARKYLNHGSLAAANRGVAEYELSE
ncbi:hypothetical protein ML372_25950, partial [Escherichia coli]|nr:hypothetical protein [Escherichia coli]